MTVELSDKERSLIVRALQELEMKFNDRGMNTAEVRELINKLQEAK